jgi:hypothetical protein
MARSQLLFSCPFLEAGFVLILLGLRYLLRSHRAGPSILSPPARIGLPAA